MKAVERRRELHRACQVYQLIEVYREALIQFAPVVASTRQAGVSEGRWVSNDLSRFEWRGRLSPLRLRVHHISPQTAPFKPLTIVLSPTLMVFVSTTTVFRSAPIDDPQYDLGGQVQALHVERNLG